MALLKNRSGVNITAETAKLFVRDAARIAPPMIFYPRQIRSNNTVLSKSAMPRSDVLMGSAAMAAEATAIIKEQNRAYRINKLSLPSDGIWHRSLINTHPVRLKEKLIWHAYLSSHLYKTFQFSPKNPLEANTLTLFYEGRRIENVPFHMENDTISLNAAIDYDVILSRKALREFLDTKGFFNNEKIKQEGYELHLSNHAKNPKEITVIERVPISTHQEITVTLDSVKGIENYTYDDETGKLEMQLSLAPRETKTIRFEYSIRYPKKMQIHY